MKKTDRKNVRLGTYAFGLSAIAVAIVIVLNLILGQLPVSITQPDISNRGLYNISDTTTSLLQDLDKDVELILIGEEDTLDERVVKFTRLYANLSDHLTYTYIDPVATPSALETYNTSANSIVVRCQETGKQTIVYCAGFQGYTDAIVSYDPTAYTQYQTLQELSFDGEGQLTAAVNYVVSEVNKTIYTLTGHGESDLGDTLTSMVEKASLALAEEPLNLLMTGSIPEDCDLLIINAPTADLVQDELDLLLDYLAQGGRLMLIIDTSDLEHFNILTQTYGLAVQPGYLGDYDRAYSMYASLYGAFCFAPTLSESSDITSGISVQSILFYPKGMTQVEPARSTISLTPFLTTSDQGFLFVDENTTLEEGPYLLGATAIEETDGGTARFTVISAASFIDDGITGYWSDLSNLDIFMNALVANFDGEVRNTSIPAISLTVENITVPNPGMWALLLIVVLPLCTLVFGLVYWLKRRKR